MLPYLHAAVYVPMYTFAVTHWYAHTDTHTDIWDALNYGHLIFSLLFSLYSPQHSRSLFLPLLALFFLDTQHQHVRWTIFVFRVSACDSPCAPLSVRAVIDVSAWSHCAPSFKRPSFFFFFFPGGHRPLQTRDDTLRTCVMARELVCPYYQSHNSSDRIAHKCGVSVCWRYF